MSSLRRGHANKGSKSFYTETRKTLLIALHKVYIILYHITKIIIRQLDQLSKRESLINLKYQISNLVTLCKSKGDIQDTSQSGIQISHFRFIRLHILW